MISKHSGLFSDKAYDLITNLGFGYRENPIYRCGQFFSYTVKIENEVGTTEFLNYEVAREATGEIVLGIFDKNTFETILRKKIMEKGMDKDMIVLCKYLIGLPMVSKEETEILDNLTGEPRNPVVAGMIQEYVLKLQAEEVAQNKEVDEQYERHRQALAEIRKSHKNELDRIKRRIKSLTLGKIPKK